MIRGRVKVLQNFTINCQMCKNELRYEVDDGFAPALEQGNFCLVEDNPPVECKVLI